MGLQAILDARRLVAETLAALPVGSMPEPQRKFAPGMASYLAWMADRARDDLTPEQRSARSAAFGMQIVETILREIVPTEALLA